MEDETEKPAITIFGRNIAEIPCFRDSYFYGIISGLAGGVGYFMFTSKVGTSTNFGFSAFCVCTLSYWSYCRWKYAEQVKQAEILRKYLSEHVRKEGVECKSKDEDVIATV